VRCCIAFWLHLHLLQAVPKQFTVQTSHCIVVLSFPLIFFVVVVIIIIMCFILFYFILFYFILFYFILFYSCKELTAEAEVLATLNLWSVCSCSLTNSISYVTCSCHYYLSLVVFHMPIPFDLFVVSYGQKAVLLFWVYKSTTVTQVVHCVSV
jgi:hypothetical protein